MRTIALAVLLIAAPASAQDSYPPVNPATYATKGEVSSAITAATPSDCGMPASDTYTGSAGSGSRCMPRADASRRTQVQTATAITVTNGDFSGTWQDSAGNPTPFPATPSYARADINVADRPHVCSVLTVTAAGFSGRCYAVASTTLPGTLTALGGLVVSPITNPSTGLTVRVIARQ